MATIVVLTILAFGALWLSYLYVAQESLIYYPRRYSEEELAMVSAAVERLEFETSQGSQTAFLIAPRDEEGKMVLVFGGNAMTALDWVDLLPVPGRPGDGFLLIDYPGYGLCEGRPSPGSIDDSVAAAMQSCAAHLGTSEAQLKERLAVIGISIGSAVALNAAFHHEIKSITLLAPFTSLQEMAARAVGSLFSHMVRHRFDNRARLEAILARGKARITIIHGDRDEVIPITMGRELAEMDPERIAFHAVPGAGHNDLLYMALPLLREAIR